LFEGNQLLRIQARQIGPDLNIVIIAIFALNWAHSGMLERYVALGDARQLHAPVDDLGRLVFPVVDTMSCWRVWNGSRSISASLF
jgi:hypothetical protein